MKESKKEEIKENELADASPEKDSSGREDKEASNNTTGRQPSNFSGWEEEGNTRYVDPASYAAWEDRIGMHHPAANAAPVYDDADDVVASDDARPAHCRPPPDLPPGRVQDRYGGFVQRGEPEDDDDRDEGTYADDD